MSESKRKRVAVASSSKAHVDKTACYRVMGTRDACRSVLGFVCVVDLLALTRTCHLIRGLVKDYWDDPRGLIHTFWFQFERQTGLNKTQMDKIRKSGGFFTGPRLAAMLAGIDTSKMQRQLYPGTCDVMLPFHSFPTTQPCERLKLTGGLVTRRWDYRPDRMLVIVMKSISLTTSTTTTTPNMCQQLTNHGVPVPRDVRACLITDARSSIPDLCKFYGIRVLEESIPQRVVKHSMTDWEQVLFDGEHIYIANVNAFLTRRGPLRLASMDNLNLDNMEGVANRQRHVREFWLARGFIVDGPFSAKTFQSKLLDPMGFEFNGYEDTGRTPTLNRYALNVGLSLS
jgi:hypothetical protein